MSAAPPSSASDVATFTTAACRGSGQDGFEAYHDLYAPVADVTALSRDFAVSVAARRLGELILFDRSLRAVRHARPPRRVSRDDFDHFTVQIPLAGSLRIETEAGERRAGAGEAAVIDMSRTMTTESHDARILTLSVPRAALDRLAPGGSGGLHGAVLPSGRAGLLADWLASTLRRSGDIAPADGPRLGDVTLELLALGLGGAGAQDRSLSGTTAALRLRARARRFIDANLSATPEVVARALGTSRSALYRAFQGSGGIAHVIRRRRLARLHALLLDRDDARRIGELAFAAGFSSDSDAIRAFRESFGMTPGECRAARDTAQAASLPAPDTVFARWWNDLR